MIGIESLHLKFVPTASCPARRRSYPPRRRWAARSRSATAFRARTTLAPESYRNQTFFPLTQPRTNLFHLKALEHVRGASLPAAAPRAIALARLDGDRVHLADHRVLHKLDGVVIE